MTTHNEPVHWLRILFDFFSIAFLFCSFQTIKLVIKPYNSSFYCNDYTINMPFKASTVTNFQLVLISLVLPFAVLISTEIFKTIYEKNSIKNKQIIIIYKIKFIGGKIVQFPEQIGNIYINCGSFFFGLVVTAILTDFGKVIVGRLRPNFIDVCKPDLNPYTQLCGLNNRTFVIPEVDFKCTNLDKADVEESRLSFPSGHSSLSFYSMIYLTLFINFTWKCRKFGLLPRIVQVALLILAIFTSLSRISDNKHHPTDVLAGAFLGIFNGSMSFIYLNNYFKKRNLKSKYLKLAMTPYDEENINENLSQKELNNFIISDIDQKFNNSFNI